MYTTEEARLKRSGQGPRPSVELKEKRPRKQFEDFQLASLDSLYIKCNGRPSKDLMKRTAQTLNMEEIEVCLHLLFQCHHINFLLRGKPRTCDDFAEFKKTHKFDYS